MIPVMIDWFVAPNETWYEPVKEIYRQVKTDTVLNDETEKS